MASDQLASAGLAVERRAEERVTTRFTDIAALVGYVRSTPWSVPEFDPVVMHERLETLHDRCTLSGWVGAVGHRFWLAARSPTQRLSRSWSSA